MFDRVLLAVDGSEDTALPVAADVAWRYGAEVLVLHVRVQGLANGPDSDAGASAQAHELVDRIVREIKDSGGSARGEIVGAPVGHVARAIVDVAEREHADLIVVGNPGPVRAGRLHAGSVCRNVAHLSSVPVLFVR
jgi:nucleotide-binding universal stress UspA family protein